MWLFSIKRLDTMIRKALRSIPDARMKFLYINEDEKDRIVLRIHFEYPKSQDYGSLDRLAAYESTVLSLFRVLRGAIGLRKEVDCLIVAIDEAVNDGEPFPYKRLIIFSMENNAFLLREYTNMHDVVNNAECVEFYDDQLKSKILGI